MVRRAYGAKNGDMMVSGINIRVEAIARDEISQEESMEKNEKRGKDIS